MIWVKISIALPGDEGIGRRRVQAGVIELGRHRLHARLRDKR